MGHRLAIAILSVLGLLAAPPAALGPSSPAPASWDPFAAAALFERLPAAATAEAFGRELGVPGLGDTRQAAPEPAGLLLLALGLLALRRPQRARAASHAAATARGERPPWSTAPFRRCMVAASIAPSSPASARTTSGRARASRAPASTTAS